jgi:hypothetical protein
VWEKVLGATRRQLRLCDPEKAMFTSILGKNGANLLA